MQRMLARGCEVFIELGPGNVLAGLLLRAQKDLTVMSVADAESSHRCAMQMRGVLA
jgi:malonyl CoA-acyl carrier protein transacylase